MDWDKAITRRVNRQSELVVCDNHSWCNRVIGHPPPCRHYDRATFEIDLDESEP